MQYQKTRCIFVSTTTDTLTLKNTKDMNILKVEELKEGMIINGNQRITNVGKKRISHRLISESAYTSSYRKSVWTTSKTDFQEMLSEGSFIVKSKQ